MSTNAKHLERIKFLLTLAKETIETQKSDNEHKIAFVNRALFKEFESLSLSTIYNIYGENHPYYTNFKESCNQPHPNYVLQGQGILVAIKAEIEKGWLDEK